jgi:hypothetical protein
LRWFGELTTGPVLVSFAGVKTPWMSGKRRLAALLPRREGREPGDGFSLHMGFHHPVDHGELERLARAAGLEVDRVSLEGRDLAAWPHAVLRRDSR